MKRSMKVTKRQLALWGARDEQIQPFEEMREEVTKVLADLLLEALGVKSPESQTGGDDESEDLT
jgi:hypothetical protein